MNKILFFIVSCVVIIFCSYEYKLRIQEKKHLEAIAILEKEKDAAGQVFLEKCFKTHRMYTPRAEFLCGCYLKTMYKTLGRDVFFYQTVDWRGGLIQTFIALTQDEQKKKDLYIDQNFCEYQLY